MSLAQKSAGLLKGRSVVVDPFCEEGILGSTIYHLSTRASSLVWIFPSALI